MTLKPVYTWGLALVMILALGAVGYSEDGHEGHDHDKHEKHGDHDKHKGPGGHDDVKPKHGGHILEVGEHKAHLEFVHDQKHGKVLLYVYDASGKGRKLEVAPRLNLKLASGKKQLKCKAHTDGVFVASDPALKGELKGKISLKVDGERYLVTIPDHHDDHKGHDHDEHKGHDH